MFEEATPEQPQQTYHYSETTGTPRWIAFGFVLAFIFLGIAVYLGYSTQVELKQQLAKQQTDSTTQLAARDTRINQLQAQLEATGRKVGMTQKDLAATKNRAEEIKKEQEAAAQQLTGQINQVATDATTKIGAVQSNVDATNTKLETTTGEIKTTLTAMKGDEGVMSGLIAKNGDDLATLRAKGERAYYEFTLTKTKSKTPTKVGPIKLLLKGTDVKASKYSVSVFVDDRVIEKKDKTADEPVQFYMQGVRAQFPFEIVIFTISKTQITGYLSAPKVTETSRGQVSQ
jgi:hypothetical protein